MRERMRLFPIIVAGMALLAMPATASATHPQEGGGSSAIEYLGGYLQQSRVLYPLRVDGWEALGEHRFERAEMGVSVRYMNAALGGRWMDLYFYPGAPFVDQAFSRAVDQTVAEIEGVIRQRDGTAFVPGVVRTFPIPDPAAAYLGEHAVKSRSYAFDTAMEGAPHRSAMAMSVRNMYFVKVRYSVPGHAQTTEQARAEAEAFLAAFMAAVRINNTGACFHPLKAAAMPEERDESRLLASADNGTAREIRVTDDQVYMTRELLAEPEAAARALAHGQAIRDALRGHCVAPEDMDTAVPDGMREIRFEYGTPGSGGATGLPASRSVEG